MLKIHTNYSLKNNHTFGVNIACGQFTAPSSLPELEYALNHAKNKKWDILVIGEGSNLLFTKPFEGLVIHPQLPGIEKVDESESEVLVRVGAGENWDNFVSYCVQNQWYGTENLSLIPGSAGSAPVQNIGAYGVEAKDIIEYVEAFDLEELTVKFLSNSECEFGYRDSIFKHGKKDKYIVSHVIFRLKKHGDLNLDYGNVNELFQGSKDKTLEGLRNTIISIRESKLPNPGQYGNAGSFFKNPVIQSDYFQLLKLTYQNIPNYPTGRGTVKIPAAWLIETAGWKGIREGDAGTWPNQPLVIVNYNNASGQEIFDFSEKIKNSIEEKFGIILEREVTVIG